MNYKKIFNNATKHEKYKHGGAGGMEWGVVGLPWRSLPLCWCSAIHCQLMEAVNEQVSKHGTSADKANQRTIGR